MQAQHRAMWQPSFVVSLGALMFLAALVAPSRIHVGWRTNDCDCEQSWERGKKGVKAACLFLSLVRAGSHITCLCTLLLATYRCVTLNVGYYGCRSLLLLGGKNNILSSGRQTIHLFFGIYPVYGIHSPNNTSFLLRCPCSYSLPMFTCCSSTSSSSYTDVHHSPFLFFYFFLPLL